MAEKKKKLIWPYPVAGVSGIKQAYGYTLQEAKDGTLFAMIPESAAKLELKRHSRKRFVEPE